MRDEWVNTMAQNYFQPEIETMPVEEIKKLQSERLVKQVKHIYDNVPFYKNTIYGEGRLKRSVSIWTVSDAIKGLCTHPVNQWYNRKTCGSFLYTA